MSEPTFNADVFFNQVCPVCGRPVRIRVNLLGRRVYCQHCGGGFTARDPAVGSGPSTEDRADELLARANDRLERATCGDAGPRFT